ncbi:hypothetical protein D9M69_619230 [compost metagenome]
MGGVIHRGLIKQHQVLVYGSAPYIKAGRAFSHGAHPGQKLNAADHVYFAQQRRHLLYGSHFHFIDRHLHTFHVMIVAL